MLKHKQMYRHGVRLAAGTVLVVITKWSADVIVSSESFHRPNSRAIKIKYWSDLYFKKGILKEFT